MSDGPGDVSRRMTWSLGAAPRPQRRVLSWIEPEELAGFDAMPPEGIIGEYVGQDFVGNAAFRDFLQAQVRLIGPTLPNAIAAAAEQGSGWIHIFDARVYPALAQDPEADVPMEDIIGGFEVLDGALTSERYWANPEHALLGARGPCVVPPEFRDAMLDALKGR